LDRRARALDGQAGLYASLTGEQPRLADIAAQVGPLENWID
jgi:hypothetical protein